MNKHNYRKFRLSDKFIQQYEDKEVGIRHVQEDILSPTK